MAAPNASGSQIAAVPLLDIQQENAPLQVEFAAALAAVCQSGRFVLGPECVQLEEEFAALCGAKHAVGCASGSDALLLALQALGVGPDDEVIVPSFTFFATVSAPWRLGARPVFVDIDPATFNLDPELVEAAVTPRTKAIVPVHLFGQCANMRAIADIAERHGLKLVEDAAQSVSACFHGQPAGGMGDVGCFSFYPTKNLGGCGDSGMMTTNDDEVAATLRKLRNHGMEPRYFHDLIGINSRLDTMQAALLRVKLPHLADWTNKRRANAVRYAQMFADAKLDQRLGLPEEHEGCFHVWNQYTIRVPDGKRDALRQHLAESKVGSEIYYPVPMHQQACFASIQPPAGSLPATEQAAAEVLSLPIFPQLTAEQQQRVVGAVGKFFAKAARNAA
ncbi:MAG: DegT/DnrJ/EryC1/StrS family aminotransferase [Planctomycetales bacterium]|nr:DegT/DnrJ/EryC1/StrS family aminotransferase [Planctomycetales bacterium]